MRLSLSSDFVVVASFGTESGQDVDLAGPYGSEDEGLDALYWIGRGVPPSMFNDGASPTEMNEYLDDIAERYRD